MGLGLNIPFNYLIGIPQLAMLMLAVFTLVALIYYFSRFKGKLNLAINTFQIINNLLLIVNYYYNSGINGPSYLIFVLSFFIAVAIVPQKQFLLWIPVNILILMSLLLFERTHLNFITNTYTDINGRFLDFGYTYLVTVALLLLVTAYIRNAYNQERLALAQKSAALELSNHTKDKLLSILAHDLKEPLSSIQGFLELLTEYKLEESEKTLIKKELLSRTKDASYLLTNVLSWTKSQMEAVKVNLTSLKLLQTLQQTIKILESIAGEKGIEFSHNLTDQVCVTGDKDMLQLVIRNLVVNAIKFTYPGGSINLKAEVLNDVCTISVTDNGSGIPEEQQSSVFSMTTRSTVGTGKEKGAGLGLILCKEFTELQGGKIGFTSKPNAGSTFFIRMKLCPNYRSEVSNQLHVLS